MPARRDRPRFLRGTDTDHPTVHTTTCAAARRSRNYKIWLRADTYTSHALAIYLTAAALQPCKRCKPIGTLATWEKFNRTATA